MHLSIPPGNLSRSAHVARHEPGKTQYNRAMLSLSARSFAPGVARCSSLAIGAVSLAILACSSPPAPTTATTYRAGQPASTPAFEYLPRGTSFVVAASGPGVLAAKLQWDQVVTRHRELHERVVAEVTQLIGHNLLDPDNLAEIGLDPQNAFGLAWVANDTPVLFAAIVDHDRFQTSVYRAASGLGTSLVPRVVGASLIISPKGSPRWHLIIRGQTALLVLSAASGAQAENAALEIAEVDIANSLAAHPDFAAAMADLRFGQDLAGFVRVDSEFRRFMGLFSLDGDLSLAFGAEIDEHAVRVKAVVPLAGDAAIARALRNSDKPSAHLSAAHARPQVALSAQVTPSSMAGMPLVAIFDEMVEPLGVEFMRDLAPTIAGEVSVTLHSTEKLAVLFDRRADILGIDVTAELGDPEKMAKILANALESPALASQVRSEVAGVYIVSIPGWKELHVGVQDRHFYASSDPEFASWLAQVQADPSTVRPRAYASESARDADIAREVTALFATRPTALRFSLDLAAVEFLTMPSVYVSDPEQIAAMMRPPPSSEDRDGHVPFSDDYKAMEGELQRLRVEAYKADAELFRVRGEKRLDLARALGSMAMRVEVQSGGLAIYGGQFFGAGDIVDALDAMVTQWLVQDVQSEAPLEERAAVVRERERELLQGLAELRERDVAAYETAHPETVPGAADTLPGVEGPLEPSDIQRLIKHQLPQLRACYERELLQQPDRKIAIVVKFMINGEGEMIRAEASGGPDRMNQCIVDVLDGMRFPRPRGGGLVEVTYPLRFSPKR